MIVVASSPVSCLLPKKQRGKGGTVNVDGSGTEGAIIAEPPIFFCNTEPPSGPFLSHSLLPSRSAQDKTTQE